MSEDRLARAASFLEWIAPPEGLEAMVAERPMTAALEASPDVSDDEVARAEETLGRIERGEQLTPEDGLVLEAIILPNERPVCDIVDGTYGALLPPFEHLGNPEFRDRIEKAIRSIGRIELPHHPSLPYGGTGFVVGTGVLMTNRHVAEQFALGLGSEQLSFRPGQTAAVDLLRERDRAESLSFEITDIVMVHPYWDMALVLADGLDEILPLELAIADPADLLDGEVAVIGYPAFDPRGNIEVQNRIFGGVYNVKRLQPGCLRNPREIESFGHPVTTVTHDSSTLGGNSGSALIDVGTGKVVGLHFAGRYLDANFAVATRELALDGRVVEAGVNFDGELPGAGTPPWSSFWVDADPPASTVPVVDAPAAAPVATGTGGEEVLIWSIPLEVTVQIRRMDDSPPATATAVAGALPLETLVEPFRDDNLSRRRGYDERFLGVRVPMPRVLDGNLVSKLDNGSYALPYEHFSVVMNKDRRLAMFTASNVSADPALKTPEQGRDYTRKGLTGLRERDQEKWFTDPRIPAQHQLPDRFFTKDRAAFDKGHIVRREDVAWGRSFDEVRRANGDTYHVTNCSPQVAGFNRASLGGRWGQLEDVIKNQAKAERYCVFAGPVFRASDRAFSGVDDAGPVRILIPRQYWKIVVARAADELRTFAFILDQDLSDVALEFAVDERWQRRMISVSDLERLLHSVELPRELHRSDQIDSAGGEAVRSATGLETYQE